nr:AbiH family protein [Halobacillus locisalis]
MLVGNGFDIQAGLHTRYADFYKYLKSKAKNDEQLKRNVIYLDIDGNEDKWSDFELALMGLTHECGDGLESRFTHTKLAQDKHEIQKYLAEYLNKVNAEFDVDANSKEIIGEFKRSISRLLNTLPIQRQEELTAKVPLTGNTNELQLNVIDFNYTSLFESSYDLLGNSLLERIGYYGQNSQRDLPVKRNGYTKIHGNTVSNMNLGGHKSQISESFADSDYYFFFDKESLELSNGTNKYKDASNYIRSSNLYIILGMSLGETDRAWWEKIAKAMGAENKALIIYEYDPNESINDSPFLRNPSIQRVKDRFMSFTENLNSKQQKSVRDRVFVQFNSKLFNLSELNVDRTDYSSIVNN